MPSIPSIMKRLQISKWQVVSMDGVKYTLESASIGWLNLLTKLSWSNRNTLRHMDSHAFMWVLKERKIRILNKQIKEEERRALVESVIRTCWF
ncbi:MAG: hypothetical protein ACD_2C00064G0007 [uncultured bacterium (gcode 4)]|uniref:Uncharacterized protein n=1 Tax=uncultured bacterium (gcode 4) TaxID=1234023 RepID=K2H2B3_9BACT|nr:MAG: hypothetical protein ACD_2C00064G0007 [uncultured bacterium (gcode 4)]